MASKTPLRLARAFRCPAASRTIFIQRAAFSQSTRQYATQKLDSSIDPPSAPYLQTLKGELKAAMRAKDTNRLAVLRAIMSANLNASKTTSPIKTDLALVRLLRRMQRNSFVAIQEAKAAGREDTVEKEQQQIDILDEFIGNSGVKFLSEDEVQVVVTRVLKDAIAQGIEKSKLKSYSMGILVKELEDNEVDKKAMMGYVSDHISKLQ